jgi:hypothetical protein
MPKHSRASLRMTGIVMTPTSHLTLIQNLSTKQNHSWAGKRPAPTGPRAAALPAPPKPKAPPPKPVDPSAMEVLGLAPPSRPPPPLPPINPVQATRPPPPAAPSNVPPPRVRWPVLSSRCLYQAKFFIRDREHRKRRRTHLSSGSRRGLDIEFTFGFPSVVYTRTHFSHCIAVDEDRWQVELLVSLHIGLAHGAS